MKKQTKKLIAPITITFLLICYFIFYIIGTLFIEDIPLNIFLIVIPLVFIILSIVMLIERIKEIKGGEEDDLGKY